MFRIGPLGGSFKIVIQVLFAYYYNIYTFYAQIHKYILSKKLHFALNKCVTKRKKGTSKFLLANLI